jgi:hypothetical protein
VRTKESLNFRLEIGSTGAALREKRRAISGRTRERLMKERFEITP